MLCKKVKGFEFRQLEAYIKVYELKSFSRAAEAMFLSQPSISAYIAALEKELKTQLIFRSTKDFTPTEAGVLFYEQAKNMVGLREEAIRTFLSRAAGKQKSISILASSVPSQFILPSLLGNYHQKKPEVIFKLEELDSLDVVNNIAAYQGEVGFVGARINNPKCVYKKLLAERLVVIAPPLEKYLDMDREGALGIIYDEYFVMRERGSGTRLWYEESLEKIGVLPGRLKVSAQFNNTQSIIQAVAHGLGLAIVSELAAAEYIERRAVLPLDLGPMQERYFYIVLRKNHEQRSVVKEFLKFVFGYTHKGPLASAPDTAKNVQQPLPVKYL